MKVIGYASWPHYMEHIAPIYTALPEEMKGGLYVPFVQMAAVLQERGIDAYPAPPDFDAMARQSVMMVAGVVDLAAAGNHNTILVEHGAGQTYQDTRSGSYAGGKGRDKAGLFLCPNDTVTEKNLFAYPHATAATVGCPRLDDLFSAREWAVRDPRGTIAISFHWDCRVSRESGTAFPYFEKQIVDYVQWAQLCGFQVLGHGHPKAWPQYKAFWESVGVVPVGDWADVAAQTDLLVVDNSSIIFEAAALDIPVVLLNSPKWRKDVEHGLRFWRDAIVGPQVEAGQPINGVDPDTAEMAMARALVANRTYGILPSLERNSTRAAANAVVEWLKGKDGSATEVP
jgi:hypothetical protein